ncbi:DivIVA domain-containing protein [Actinoplanes derwentensis]|uniref:Cell wall synthesis protein Wag31 n=1 Tax=Actinoplanes derwentensis TaxID=113562 RepID=A0A1H1ZY84_9ACTN|nr:DivIVA domain-containing protein [Actinoplanes derwentensis]GID83475.1 cell wall synthesis protein Wag31 [Actinoplanes derwentensis]SDT38725.1 DivIVA domain-containing protein [Actinoplanes derwentensis]
MPITPADIHNMDFRRPPIGKRGYDEEEVDAFLDEASQELVRLIEENSALSDRLRRDGAPDLAATTVLNGDAAELMELTARLRQLRDGLSRAEHDARDMQVQLERARDQARSAPPPKQAMPADNDRVLMMAQRTAEEHVRDAQMESDVLLSDARAKADQVTGDARRTAGAIEADAQRNHSDAMDGLARDRAAALDEIDRLGQLAVGYRSALDHHVHRQLEDLDGSPGIPPNQP